MENYPQLSQRIEELYKKKKIKESIQIPNGIYVFVSFDLVNSTKFKYRNHHWIDMIKELIKTANNHWFGLDFWKFNGDELLYYTELTSISQLVVILHKLNCSSNELEEELKQKMNDDKSEIGFESDLIGIKTAIWLAVVSDHDNSLNSKLFDFESVDFAGINMDEGFRMSKCATQNKIVVDPKIALLICSMADEVMNKRVQNLTDNDKSRIKELSNPINFDDVFSKFWLEQPKYDFEIEDMLKVVANNFRMIGFENCKGVWDDRPYPIIWYSDNWEKVLVKVKYDERYKDNLVDNNFINHYYENEKESSKVTLEILKKIYDNVSPYSVVIRKILLECNLKLWTSMQLDKRIVSKTYLYHSVVCVNESTKGVMVFLRSKDRGHLPCVWDFDHQKNAQDIYGESLVKQIEDRIKKNFDLNVKIIIDKKRRTLLPLAIHPVYRKGKMHHGIICMAFIKDTLTEDELLTKVRKRLPEMITGYGYPFYSDVEFIHKEQLHYEENGISYFTLSEQEIFELTDDETCSDSNSWRNHEKSSQTQNKCTTNFVLTIQEVLDSIENGEIKNETNQ